MPVISRKMEFENKARSVLNASYVFRTTTEAIKSGIGLSIPLNSKAFVASENFKNDHARDDLVIINTMRAEGNSVDEIVLDLQTKVGEMRAKFPRGTLWMVINSDPRQDSLGGKVYWNWDAWITENDIRRPK